MSDNTLRIGSVLHGPKRDYTVKSVLGQGGFGITYLVEGKVRVDNILVDAKFAVKEFFISSLCWRDDSQRLAYSKSQSDIINRSLRAFVREADRLKSLNINHPNLLNINEVFEANGTAYYVMEYLNGGSLAQYIKQRGRLSWDETVALCKPIVDAVALLHTNQVTHYDIKPQNIMLVQDGNNLRPVLIDFGLAKHYDAQGNATSTGLSGGYTPGYAPVEQYHGIRSFQPTADVYALAATIYHCLTGHAPAAAEVLDLDAVCDELLNLNVSEEAVNILLQALDIHTSNRPADAGVLLAALFDGTTQAMPQSLHYTLHSQSTVLNTVANPRPQRVAPASPAGQSQVYAPTSQPAPVANRNRTANVAQPIKPKTKSKFWQNVLQVLKYIFVTGGFLTFVGAWISFIEYSEERFGFSTTWFYVLFIICALITIGVFIRDEIKVHKQGVKSWWMSWWCRLLKFVVLGSLLSAGLILIFDETLRYEGDKHGCIIATINGSSYMFSYHDWQRKSPNDQSQYAKSGIVIDKGFCAPFVVKMEYEHGGQEFNWDETQQIVSNSFPWRLPTKEEAAYMDSYEIRYYYSDRGPNSELRNFWTSTKSDNFHVSYKGEWYLLTSDLHYNTKHKVRLVRDL